MKIWKAEEFSKRIDTWINAIVHLPNHLSCIWILITNSTCIHHEYQRDDKRRNQYWNESDQSTTCSKCTNVDIHRIYESSLNSNARYDLQPLLVSEYHYLIHSQSGNINCCFTQRKIFWINRKHSTICNQCKRNQMQKYSTMNFNLPKLRFFSIEYKTIIFTFFIKFFSLIFIATLKAVTLWVIIICLYILFVGIYPEYFWFQSLLLLNKHLPSFILFL